MHMNVRGRHLEYICTVGMGTMLGTQDMCNAYKDE
jgi:hypothetical protein